METTIYNAQGKKSGTLALPEQLFGVAWNDALMHQVVTGMQANARTPVAHVKDRSEVRGGGKKPWKQKGTGRARHGSIRSPIWIGGGVTHGPRKEKDYSQTIPKKMRAKAFFMALSKKFKDGEIIFVDSFGLEKPKTASAQKSLALIAKQEGFEKLATKKRNAAVVALADTAEATEKSFRNIGNVKVVAARNLNPVNILGATYLIIENPEASIAIFATRAEDKRAKKADAATK
jgi:large subunit ribosomal protein L4